jgi:WD40 repeat protein
MEGVHAQMISGGGDGSIGLWNMDE